MTLGDHDHGLPDVLGRFRLDDGVTAKADAVSA